MSIPKVGTFVITILAKAESKGCPGKHLRKLGKYSLLEHTFFQARVVHGLLGSGGIIVSTDSVEVADLARQFKFRVYEQRPRPTATTPKVPAIRNAVLDWLEDKCVDPHTRPQWVLDLDVTAPLRSVEDMAGALNLAYRTNPDCVLSCTQGVGRNPYFNLLELDPSGQRLIRSKSADDHITCRQSAPRVYEANSSIYVYSRDFLLNPEVTSPLDGRCVPYVMDDESYYHVDSELDFFIVGALLRRRHNIDP